MQLNQPALKKNPTLENIRKIQNVIETSFYASNFLFGDALM